MIGALLLAAQAATPAAPLPAAGTPPQRIYLLNCPEATGDEIVVCGETAPVKPDRGPPDRPVPSNPALSARVALGQQATPCSATQWGCASQVDLVAAGTAAIRFVGKLIDPESCCDHPGEATDTGALIGDVAKAFRKKPDRSKRIAIDLDAPPPPIGGRLAP